MLCGIKHCHSNILTSFFSYVLMIQIAIYYHIYALNLNVLIRVWHAHCVLNCDVYFH